MASVGDFADGLRSAVEILSVGDVVLGVVTSVPRKDAVGGEVNDLAPRVGIEEGEGVGEGAVEEESLIQSVSQILLFDRSHGIYDNGWPQCEEQFSNPR